MTRQLSTWSQSMTTESQTSLTTHPCCAINLLSSIPLLLVKQNMKIKTPSVISHKTRFAFCTLPSTELSVIHHSWFCGNFMLQQLHLSAHAQKLWKKPLFMQLFSQRGGRGSIGVFRDLTIVRGSNLWICEEYYHNGRYPPVYNREPTQHERRLLHWEIEACQLLQKPLDKFFILKNIM